MSYEGYNNYQCECGQISEGWDVYGESPETCQCGKDWLYYQAVDNTNSPPCVRPWRSYR